jgi:hypothetical protein
VPELNVLLLPGVVEAIVADALAEFKPVLLSFAHTSQPFLAFVFTVAVRGVGLEVTDPLLKLPSESVLPLNAKLKVCGTVAVTTI